MFYDKKKSGKTLKLKATVKDKSIKNNIPKLKKNPPVCKEGQSKTKESNVVKTKPTSIAKQNIGSNKPEKKNDHKKIIDNKIKPKSIPKKVAYVKTNYAYYL